MVKNCVSCINRTKADEKLDSNGGDFWYCTAKVVWPSFVMQMTGAQYAEFNKQVNRLFNLNLFKEDTTYYEGLQRDCPLWSQQNEMQTRHR